ncbi:hypothetical protein [Actinomadura rupiterrae]|uniref:hypothetical protein n=1 Tax=Actinomadura rupiterrae TaxID=559627 RepID=UPI0020A33D38|nr:hypothetical protein [Actinomadura rupiterrae]MCP2336753.1 hypothetical protein [Actinomadura rupiterrae]
MLALATTALASPALATTVLADNNLPLNNDTVSPGFLGFGVFLALGVVLFFLVRSMNKQMKKIQAPKEADLKQQEWERAEAAKAGGSGDTADKDKAAASSDSDG